MPPSPIWELMRQAHTAGAVEIFYLRGALNWQTAQHDQQADPGCWLLARWPAGAEPQDGWAAAYAPEVPDGPAPE